MRIVKTSRLTPRWQGPLVSTKESTQAIAMDYANADPTLATKTSVWPFFFFFFSYQRDFCVCAFSNVVV